MGVQASDDMFFFVFSAFDPILDRLTNKGMFGIQIQAQAREKRIERKWKRRARILARKGLFNVEISKQVINDVSEPSFEYCRGTDQVGSSFDYVGERSYLGFIQ